MPVIARQDGFGSISGKLLGPDGKKVEYASVVLLKQGESGVTKGTLSDSTGAFRFDRVLYGHYVLKISFTGYKTHISEPVYISALNNSITTGAIKLVNDDRILETVVIKAAKPLVEQATDRVILNVENSILSEGSTALELLARAPGVTVDEEGSVSIKGRAGTTVMLNGKLTYLSGGQLANLLKGTSSSAVSRIEVISNPSAKYDAAGNAGIVNIVLKKNNLKGYNGSVTVNGGSSRNARYGAGGALNFRNGKLNAFGNYNYAYRGETEYLGFERLFFDRTVSAGEPGRISLQNTSTNEPLHTHNFRTGLDFYVDGKNTLGFLINGNTGKYTHDSKTGNILHNTLDNTIISNSSSANYDKQRWENISYNLNYTRRLSEKGSELSADVDFSSNKFSSDLRLDTRYRDEAGAQLGELSARKGNIPASTYVYAGKIDYLQMFERYVKIESGLKSSYVKADNNLRYDTLRNGSWVYDGSSSNHFKYTEQIHAGYLNLNKEYKTLSVQAGLRAEYTHTRGHQITADSLVTRSYLQLFPSVFISKKFRENDKAQLAYSRRIERPGYDDLNPFRVFRDPFLFYQGNPFIKPELTHTVQLSYNLRNRYTVSANYNYTRDVMNWLMGQIDSINTTFQSPQNLRSFTNYGLSFNAATNFIQGWSGNHFANVYYNSYKGHPDGAAMQNSITSFSFNSQNTIKITQSVNMELSGFYNSRTVYGISSGKAYYALSAGLQKSVLNKMGSIKLTVNDIFQTNQLRRRSLYDNINMNTHIRLDSRVAMFSFSYRFGNQSIKSRERSTGSEEVQGRVKGG